MSEINGDEHYVQYLQEHLYHPRSNAHINTLCDLILDDLQAICGEFFKGRRLVYKHNYTINPGSLKSWKANLVIGPAEDGQELDDDALIVEGDPKRVFIAVDSKSIMTEHAKARRDRQRDLVSFDDIVHKFDQSIIVAGLVVINIASRFKSPLRQSPTEHRNIERLVAQTVGMMHDIPYCETPKGDIGIDAMGVIVVDHTNIPGEASKLHSGDPAPAPESRLHYRSFVKDICEAYRTRFVW